MTTTLKTADRIARITLSLAVIIFYALGLITGPFALALFILAGLMVLTSMLIIAFKWVMMD